jgi:phage gp29-like protein
MCKNYAIKDWMRFIEIYGMATRVGRYGPNATPQDKAILKRAVINIGADAAAIIPDSMKIEFVQPGNQNAGLLLYKGTAEWLDKQMSKAVLGQTASSEGTPGKLGGQDGQEEVRRDILRKDAKKLAATYNAMLVRPYIDLNHGPQKRYPVIKWIIKDPEDIKSLADSVGALVDRGLRVGQSEMRDKLGLADPGEDAEVLVSPKVSASGTPAPASNCRLPIVDRRLKNRTALNAQGDDGDIADELEQIALNGWKPLMTPVKDALQQLADDCDDEEEFKRRLPEALNGMDMSHLTDSLADFCFRARGAGDAE